MNIYDGAFLDEHRGFVQQVAEVAATAVKARLADEVDRRDLDDMYVEVSVWYSGRTGGNVKLMTGDADLQKADLRETEPIASRRASFEVVR